MYVWPLPALVVEDDLAGEVETEVETWTEVDAEVLTVTEDELAPLPDDFKHCE